MYNIVPLILILISLSVIVVIIVKKFSALANLDVDNITAEKEAKFKEQIIGKKLKRNIIRHLTKFNKIIKPLGIKINHFFQWGYGRLHDLKQGYKDNEELADSDIDAKVKKLFFKAEEFRKQKDLTEMEKIYIKIIGLDSQNIRAFKDLAQVYAQKKEYKEAKQTLKHILKLNKDDEVYERSQIYFDLAIIYNEEGSMDSAKENLDYALQIEPNNPRYLDLIIEINIINKDKESAYGAYKRLKEVNPDNKKLTELKNRINKL
jgi:tetratricopeptide (TPR) repeat protein